MTWIFKLFFNLLGNISCQKHHLILVNLFGLDHDSDFTAGLNCIAACDARDALGDFLKLFKALDIVFNVLASCAGAGCGYCVSRLNDAGNDGLGFNIAVVGLDCVLGKFVKLMTMQ